MVNLSVGENLVIPLGMITVKINSGFPVDASAFRLFANGKVKDDLDMIFYGQPKNENGSISWERNNRNNQFMVDLSRLSGDVQKIAFTITCDEYEPISNLKNLSIQLEHDNEVFAYGEVDITGRQEKALIMGEIYQRNNNWKFRYIAQGFNGGLKPLAEHYGVNVTEDVKPQSSPVPPPPITTPTTTVKNSTSSQPINLSKISLSKEQNVISLSKKTDYGRIGINLNWHRNENAGFFSKLLNNNNVDLDLGAFVRLQDNSTYVIQALGNSFGSLNAPFYVQLMGDDRSGNDKDGEWIYVNGSCWNKIDEILIYTFIYEGVPSWDKTDGIVRIHVPDQPIIETCLTEGDNRKILCAIARLKNDKGAIKVERINRYFQHQQDLDDAYGWGFHWGRGSK